MQPRLSSAPRYLLAALLLGGAWSAHDAGAQSPRFFDDDPIWEEPNSQDASGVQPWDINLGWDLVENLFVRPRDRGPSVRAVNVNTVDEVPDGAWFHNRLGSREMSTEEMAMGPNASDGPAAGVWTIVDAKSDGITPGFTVRDSAGVTWFIKFDPPGWRGMATGTEVVVSKLLWALGYHTPEYHIARMPSEGLALDPEARIRPPGASPRPMRQSDIAWLLERAARNPDGTYRVIASRRLPGRPLGGFRFYGTRPDDPNDVFPHQHRRELRGYGTFSAWLNHVDAKSINTMDVLVTENGQAYVRHYLLDFGSTLGSAAVGPREHWEGHEYLVEPADLGRGIVKFGLYVKPWRTLPLYEHPAIGRLPADNTTWDPEAWKPRIPNPAFLRARPDDKFWAARKLSALSDGLIRVAVRTGEFDDEAAEAVLTRVLIERRDAITRRYLPAVNPIVNPALDAGGRLTFDNAAVSAGVAEAPAAHHVQWSVLDNATGDIRPIGVSHGEGQAFDPPPGLPAAQGAFVRVAISSSGTNPEWEKPVHAYFRRTTDGWRLVGLDRFVDAGS